MGKLHKRFNIPSPAHPQFTPADYSTPTYSQKQQFAKESPSLKWLSSKDIKYIEEIIGTILYYYCVTNPMPLVALSSITSQQSKVTDATQKVL